MSGRVLAQRERLLRSSLQLLGDPEGAQELVVLCLLSALRSPLLLRFAADEAGDEALALWLERMLVQRVLQRLREALPMRRSVGDASSDETPTTEEPAAGRSGELWALQRTGQALAVLPPLARIAVVLVVMQRRPLDEAAELLGCSPATCSFWLGHGRKLLRRTLQRDLLQSDESDVEPRSSQLVTVPGALHELRRNKKAIARA